MNGQKGSLTITAFFTLLIFSLYGVLLFGRSASSYIRQTSAIETIEKIYSRDIPNASTIAKNLDVNI